MHYLLERNVPEENRGAIYCPDQEKGQGLAVFLPAAISGVLGSSSDPRSGHTVRTSSRSTSGTETVEKHDGRSGLMRGQNKSVETAVTVSKAA